MSRTNEGTTKCMKPSGNLSVELEVAYCNTCKAGYEYEALQGELAILSEKVQKAKREFQVARWELANMIDKGKDRGRNE